MPRARTHGLTTSPAGRGARRAAVDREAIERARAAADPQWFLFESGYVLTKDEHDAITPVKPFPTNPYLRALLDLMLLSGHLRPPTREAIPWAWAEFPPALLEETERASMLFVEKSRQIMATWLTCAYCWWRARAYPHQLILVQSKREQDAATLVFTKSPTVARMSFLEDRLPAHLRQTTWPKSGTFGHLLIDHPDGATSHIWAIPEGGDVIRSNTPSVVFADEAAFQPGFGLSYTAALPAIRGGGQYIAVSSAEPGEFERLVEADRVR
jgi:hypothetical protein